MMDHNDHDKIDKELQAARDTAEAFAEARDYIMKASKILSYQVAEPYQAGTVSDISDLRKAFISVESKRLMIEVDLPEDD